MDEINNLKADLKQYDKQEDDIGKDNKDKQKKKLRAGDTREDFDSSQDGSSGDSSSSGDKEYNDDDSDGSDGGLAKNFNS